MYFVNYRVASYYFRAVEAAYRRLVLRRAVSHSEVLKKNLRVYEHYLTH